MDSPESKRCIFICLLLNFKCDCLSTYCILLYQFIIVRLSTLTLVFVYSCLHVHIRFCHMGWSCLMYIKSFYFLSDEALLPSKTISPLNYTKFFVYWQIDHATCFSLIISMIYVLLLNFLVIILCVGIFFLDFFSFLFLSCNVCM